MKVSALEVEQWLDRLYVAADGAGLREEDKRKAREVAAMLDEIERAVARFSQRTPLILVDAAAGKSYVGLLSARLVLQPMGRQARVITIERDAARVKASLSVLDRLCADIPIECRQADVAADSAWPEQASIVTALHACGPAADVIIDRAIAIQARLVLLVPCCTSNVMESSARAAKRADEIGIPRQAPVRRKFIQAMVDSERTWRLEAAGYETEVVEFVSPTVTPYNLLWRARLVREPRRSKSAQRVLQAWSAGGTPDAI
jgi:hypothetical protein